MNYVQIAVAAPIRRLFSYCVPVSQQSSTKCGQLVEVSFGNGIKRGVVIEEIKKPPCTMKIKTIARVVEDEPVLTSSMLRVLLWAAQYYLVPQGEMIFAALPPEFRKVAHCIKSKHVLVAELCCGVKNDAIKRTEQRAPRQARVLQQLLDSGPTLVRDMQKEIPTVRTILRALEKKGLIRMFYCSNKRASYNNVDMPSPPVIEALTHEQQQALNAIKGAMDQGQYKTFLLHGVTGSGKTEVYLRAIGNALCSTRGAILLVPEISLTPQLVSRVKSRFGEQVAVLHSAMGESARVDEWWRLRVGKARVAVGARSAVFAPVRSLGIIVVDEEHDPSYKQSERLPYNARDLAMVRARQERAVVVLGTATPCVESYAHAQCGRTTLLELKNRVYTRPMPEVEIVDLREIYNVLERAHTLSPCLAQALAETLDNGEQAILFLNRRGYSAFALCKDCGEAITCSNCSVGLTYHLYDRKLHCHYCGLTIDVPSKCPFCKRGRIQLFGIGTEKCAEEVRRRFPLARVLRLDSDSASPRGTTQRVMAQFARGDADVLVGTQMVTKGHDIPGVTLVGVVLADLGFHLPDFRATEHTFQLLVQAAGRAGRGIRPGRVIVQTFLPKHESIEFARKHCYKDFFEREYARRKFLGYPPKRRLLMVRISHPEAKIAAQLAHSAVEIMRAQGLGKIQLLGPVASPLARIRGRYRWQALLKSERIEELHRVALGLDQQIHLPAKGKILFDMDPVDML